MKKILSCSLILLLSTSLCLNAEEIKVDLDCRAAEGPVVVMVFDSPESFRGLKAPLLEQVVDCEAGFQLPSMNLEDFAVVVYFDQNQNGKLDRNFMGIPSEPLGFSAGYAPKGPPQYVKARLQSRDLDGPIAMEVSPGLGPRGRIGVGGLLLYRSSIYAGQDSGEFRVFPGLSYIGKRVQILGPNVNLGLWNTERVKTAIVGSFRGGAYEESDGDALEGLGDREDTFMVGLSLSADLGERFALSAKLQADALDRIGGWVAEGALSYSATFMKFDLAPYVGLIWESADIAEHDYGVDAYDPGDVISPQAGLRVMRSWRENWVGLLNLSITRLDDAIYDSPIVDERMQASGFVSLMYQF